MRGVVIIGDRRVELRAFDDPSPGFGEVVIAIKASGMCGTDLHRFRDAPEEGGLVISGHEPAGIVIATGEGVPAQMVGRRVMVHHYEGCMACASCRTGWTQMCETPGAMRLHGRTAHGSHAPYMKVPAYSILPLPDELSFEAGAAIGCGTGTAWGALMRMGLSGRETIAVFGQGPVGASATILAAAHGAKVIAIDVQDTRIEAARQLGASHLLNSRNGDAAAQIRELTGGKGVDLVLETSGVDSACSAAIDCLSSWGKACFVGVGAHVGFDVYAILRRQLTMMTSWTLSWNQQRECADFVVKRGLNLDSLFSHHWTLDDAQEAFLTFDRQDAGKGVFVFS